MSAFNTMPGPGDVDIAAYNTYSDKYVTQLHAQYGDIFRMNMSSVTRASQSSSAAPVVFVRNVESVKQRKTILRNNGALSCVTYYTVGAP
jgi:hypothetical protein